MPIFARFVSSDRSSERRDFVFHMFIRQRSKQTEGLETFLRRPHARTSMPLWPHVCRAERKATRQLPGQPTQTAFA